MTGHQISCDHDRGCPAFFDAGSFCDAAETRRRAALTGWQTALAGPLAGSRRLDLCPLHVRTGFRPRFTATTRRGVCPRCGKDLPLVATRRGDLVLDQHTPGRPAPHSRWCPGTHERPVLHN